MESKDSARRPMLHGLAAEVARRVGVSQAAVSYALNGRPGVSDEMRSQILDVARKLGLDVSPSTPRGFRAFGLVLADVGNPFYSEFAISVNDAARAAGYELLIGHTNDDAASVLDSVTTMVEHRVDGILLTAVQSGNAEIVRVMRKAKMPFVQISRRLADIDGDFVGIDDMAASKEIMEHVVWHGYTSISTVVGPDSSTASSTRAKGFHQVAESAGIEIPAPWKIRTSLGESGGRSAAEYLLSLGALPRAIVCGTDAIALGIMDAFGSARVRVPEDVAMTGFDGLTSARSSLIDITTSVQPRHLMAHEAVRLLTDRREDASLKRVSILCPHRFHLGKTCGCI